MAQVVGMATIDHEYAGIVSVLSDHVNMHVVPFYSEYNQLKTLPLCSTKLLSMFHCVRVVFILIGVLTLDRIHVCPWPASVNAATDPVAAMGFTL
jgi:hypothetical protein